MVVEAGKLRERVTLQANTAAAADSYGAAADTWYDLGEAWAEIVMLSGREAMQALQQQADATHRVMLRYRSDFDSFCRVKWGTRYLYPLSVVADAKRTQLTCLCAEQLKPQ